MIEAGADMLCFHPFLGSLTVFLLSLEIHLYGVHSASKEDVEKHLELGKRLLSSGQLAEALQHYHEAIEGDQSNYLSYFQRATVYLAIGKSKSALPDLNKVIELKPDFSGARQQRANIYLKQGKLSDAQEDYKYLLKYNPENSEAKLQLDSIPQLKDEREEAKEAHDEGDYQTAIELLTKAIEASPWDPDLRDLRADCYIQIGDYFKAIGDIRPTTKLVNDNTAAFLKLSKILYQIGEADDALTEIRECLKLDPDHPQCFPHYKKVKKLVKQMKSTQENINSQSWADCVNKAKQMMKTENKIDFYLQKAKSHICHCHAKAGNVKEALNTCNEVLSIEPDNIEAICDRADAYLSDGRYDEAIRDFQDAINIDGNHQRSQEGIQRSQKLKKQASKRDYYKILGVRRNASKKDIKTAYRKLAVKWHPDKYEGDDKKKAEKMFIDIAAAKEVLSDPEKREKFDNGEDPLDPEQQQGGHGGDPWFHGFNPFGHGGFQFKYNFN
ncbi:dnaJ homolog subfamily C member 3-like [Tubulanus polymorphus]|uniref:dnaJ homolog subfamily C member 3-like n=1 Tax=Tubulanus polymorphus TaxID=672921 RepID=UPI003DA42D5D